MEKDEFRDLFSARLNTLLSNNAETKTRPYNARQLAVAMYPEKDDIEMEARNIRNWLNPGTSQPRKFKELLQLAEIFNCSIEYLLGADEKNIGDDFIKEELGLSDEAISILRMNKKTRDELQDLRNHQEQLRIEYDKLHIHDTWKNIGEEPTDYVSSEEFRVENEYIESSKKLNDSKYGKAISFIKSANSFITSPVLPYIVGEYCDNTDLERIHIGRNDKEKNGKLLKTNDEDSPQTYVARYGKDFIDVDMNFVYKKDKNKLYINNTEVSEAILEEAILTKLRDALRKIKKNRFKDSDYPDGQ